MVEPIVVPVRHVDDVERVGPIAVLFARALERRILFVHVAHPDDDVAERHRRFGEAVGRLAMHESTPMSLQVVESLDEHEAVTDACVDHLIVMATAASPFRDHHYVGSCAASILARSTRPVVLVGPAMTRGTSPERVYLAATDHGTHLAARRQAEHLARVFGELPVATLTIDPDGVVYEHDYDDAHFDRPDEIHARLQPTAVKVRELGPTLARYAADGVLVIPTQARTGLAWICEGSVAFDAIAASTGPVVALGPAAV